jgi:PAS domain S-box-containing protein
MEEAPDQQSGRPAWDLSTFQSLFESAPDATIVVDEHGRIVLANTTAEELFGYPRNELLGQTVELLIPERYRDAHVDQGRAYMEQPRKRAMGHPGLNLSGRRKDGSEFPVEIALGPVPSARGQLVTAIIRDVSVRGASVEEQRIRGQVEEYAELLRNSFTHLDSE